MKKENSEGIRVLSFGVSPDHSAMRGFTVKPRAPLNGEYDRNPEIPVDSLQHVRFA